MKAVIGFILTVIILTCGLIIAEEENLWIYLEGFRNSNEMPSSEEIIKRFGEPDDKQVEWEENTDYPKIPNPAEYIRFTDEDKKTKWLPVVGWLYYWKSDKDRWIYVIVRKKEGTVVGWQWFENVPPGEEIGPPK